MPFKRITNLLSLPCLVSHGLRGLKQQKLFMREHLAPLLKESLKEQDGSINHKNIKRISNYYALAVPVISELYSRMILGHKLRKDERLILSYMGALTCLFDDYFDEKETAQSHLIQLLTSPETAQPNNAHERLFLQLYRRTQQILHSDSFTNYALEINKAQLLSQQQYNSHISNEELETITEQKGGISLLFYRLAIHCPLTANEKQLLHHIGYMGQLENDIFDIYEDLQEGIHTLATKTPSIPLLQDRYNTLLQESYRLIDQGPGQAKQKQEFKRFVALIASRGTTCLQQLSQLEKANNSPLDFNTLDRKQLICDMSQLKNKTTWLNHYLNWNR